MSSIPYYGMSRAPDHKYFLRLQLVLDARSHAAARALGCSHNTVRLWLRRLEQGGRSDLIERSRAPHRCPHKTSSAQEKKVLEARATLPCAGPRRLQDLFGLLPSQRAIARILRLESSQLGSQRIDLSRQGSSLHLAAVSCAWRACA